MCVALRGRHCRSECVLHIVEAQTMYLRFEFGLPSTHALAHCRTHTHMHTRARASAAGTHVQRCRSLRHDTTARGRHCDDALSIAPTTMRLSACARMQLPESTRHLRVSVTHNTGTTSRPRRWHTVHSHVRPPGAGAHPRQDTRSHMTPMCSCRCRGVRAGARGGGCTSCSHRHGWVRCRWRCDM